MRILILGGTKFIGRDFVEYLLQTLKGWDIYIANRNISNPNLFNNCKHIEIDRMSEDGCDVLRNHARFDVVVDFSCYDARQLYRVLKNLSYGKYYVISSTSSTDDLILNDKSHPMYNYATDKLALENYINGEDVKNSVNEISIIRPCIVYGEHDYTNRFYKKDDQWYWKHQDYAIHNNEYFIYIRDFTNKLLNIIISNTTGTITITGKNYCQIHPRESRYLTEQIFEEPFKHIIVDDLFEIETYKKICLNFPSFLDGVQKYKDTPNAKGDYEGIITGLGVKTLEKTGLGLFASKVFQNYIEEKFDIETTKFIAPSAHLHDPPSKNGYIHTDYNMVSFQDTGEDGFVSCNVDYTDDTIAHPDTKKLIRSIALLYYLDNDDSLESIGGGTGIYDRSGQLIKSVEPKNNRLLIFEMTHNSYHAFIGANFKRSCIVSWFHSEPVYMRDRHKDIGGESLVERWTDDTENYWTIDKGYRND